MRMNRLVDDHTQAPHDKAQGEYMEQNTNCGVLPLEAMDSPSAFKNIWGWLDENFEETVIEHQAVIDDAGAEVGPCQAHGARCRVGPCHRARG